MFVVAIKSYLRGERIRASNVRRGIGRYRIMHDYDKMKLKQGGTDDKE
jgi:hypothetical protein